MSWNVGSRPVTAAPLRLVPDKPADRQQAAERDDEGRHADVGDDETLDRADAARRGRCPMASARTHWNGTSGPIPRMCGNQSVIHSA